MAKDKWEEKIQDVEAGFTPYLPKEEGYAKTVLEAMNYSIQAGGKRLRPMFLYETFLMLGGEDEKAVRPFMMAMEMIHTYSLVHDDLPAMDNDDYRRGKLTTHKKYGEAMGILAGDALLNAAYETAFLAFDSDTPPDRIGGALRVLGHKAGIYGMVGGQVVDVENNGSFVEENMLHYVYKNKTAALIEGSLMIGGILAGAGEEKIQALEEIGTYIGLAFQIQDDILDIVGEEDVIGKPVHSDEKNEKSTYVAMHGLETSRQKVREYTKQGIETLNDISVKRENDKEFLSELLLSLVEREK